MSVPLLLDSPKIQPVKRCVRFHRIPSTAHCDEICRVLHFAQQMKPTAAVPICFEFRVSLRSVVHLWICKININSNPLCLSVSFAFIPKHFIASKHWAASIDRPWPPHTFQSSTLTSSREIRPYRFACFLIFWRVTFTVVVSFVVNLLTANEKFLFIYVLRKADSYCVYFS